MISQSLPAVNLQIEQLYDQIRQLDQENIDWLVIAHNDSLMLNKLERAFEEQTMAVLAVPQSSWALADSSAEQLLQWAVEEMGVKGVLLVGHSRGGTPDEQVRVVANRRMKSNNARATQELPLMDRIRMKQDQLACCEQHFVRQLGLMGSTLKSIPDANRFAQVAGLFYRAESGTFCLYDQHEKSFHALLPDPMVA